MSKIISEVKLLALLLQAYTEGHKTGKLDEFMQAHVNDYEAEEAKHKMAICLALVEQASIQGD